MDLLGFMPSPFWGSRGSGRRGWGFRDRGLVVRVMSGIRVRCYGWGGTGLESVG